MEIHIDRGGQRYGPYSLEDARNYLADGSLLPTDLAWHEGMSDWLPLRQIAGIGNSPAASAPPPPRSHGAAVSPGVRPLEARAEESQKGTLVLVLGILLIVSAILPVYNPMAGSMSGMPGAPSSI